MLLTAEGLASAGGNLLVAGIYFYTKNVFHWTLGQNFLLASAQGVVYIAGALSANAISRRIGAYRALALCYFVMMLLPLLALVCGAQHSVFTILLLLYNCTASVNWPIMESLASSGLDTHALSRRIALYNVIWSAVAVIMIAVDGTLIDRWPGGVFIIPAIGHGASALMMLRLHLRLGRDEAAEPAAAVQSHAAPAHAEPELLRMRTLALWLSRVALPATYVAIFSLMALMPSLPVMKNLNPSTQTLISCTWMATRCLAFGVLGLTAWWHTRPLLLPLSAVVMLLAFLGVTLRPSDFLPGGSFALDLTCMLIAQLALGAVLGLIYCASLYFGMVLSDGSTEHGGYHEALIGLGYVLGPGTGAVAEALRPRNVYVGISAVATVVFLSVVAVGVTALLARRRAGQGA